MLFRSITYDFDDNEIDIFTEFDYTDANTLDKIIDDESIDYGTITYCTKDKSKLKNVEIEILNIIYKKMDIYILGRESDYDSKIKNIKDEIDDLEKDIKFIEKEAKEELGELKKFLNKTTYYREKKLKRLV